MTIREFWESMSDEEKEQVNRQINSADDLGLDIELNDAVDVWALLSPEQQKKHKCPE